jgi:predicted short-subunit dehydrogenase-like oxidoreductase (DUF2520 family)
MQNIVVIGAGNLAWHLVVVLQQAGYAVTMVSRKPETVADWPVRVLSLNELIEVPDLIFLAVPDDAIEMVSTNLSYTFPDRIPIVHTSGATPVTKIDAYFRQRGSLWPIRSLRRGEPVGNWREVPLAYHGSDEALTQVLGELSSKLSDLSYALNDEQRARLHLAAVFSNNFVNWLYQISYELVTEVDIPFDTLLPIIRDTALKQSSVAPKAGQSGPAARGDTATMARQLDMLKAHPDKAQLYQEISRLIKLGVNDLAD